MSGPHLAGHHTTMINFNEAAGVANKVVTFLEGAHVPLGVGLVGLMMVIAQQSCPDDDPAPERIGKMVEDLGEYIGAYWGGGD